MAKVVIAGTVDVAPERREQALLDAQALIDQSMRAVIMPNVNIMLQGCVLGAWAAGLVLGISITEVTPCLRQNVHMHRRSGIWSGATEVANRTTMAPQ